MPKRRTRRRVTLADRLERLNIHSGSELLEHIPRRYEDWTVQSAIAKCRIGEVAVIHAEVSSLKAERTLRRRMGLATAILQDQSGQMEATWFHQPYLAKTLQAGQSYYFRGTVGWNRQTRQKQFINPRYERQARILPVYPETRGLTSKMLRRLIASALTKVSDIYDPLPPIIQQKHNFFKRRAALTMLHQPQTWEDIVLARHRLGFEELYRFALRLSEVNAKLSAAHAPAMEVTDEMLAQFVESLPFELTNAQRKSAWEIIKDLRERRPMNRLLEGDVGSGKTVVAAFAAYVAAQAGYSTVWMVPTEILAKQHVETVKGLLRPFSIPVFEWTAKAKEREALQTTGAKVVVGTHALLHEAGTHQDVGLVVIDEQHRFGVEQRALLTSKSEKTPPHFLSMTATPIPRTLALALYAHLRLSILDERPSGRQEVKTRVVLPGKRPAIYEKIREEVSAGRQAFVVCPRIEEVEDTEGSEHQTATKVFKYLSRDVYPDLQVGLIHGRLKSEEKQRIMGSFARGELDILVTTTVIEVGIDVPNASVMLIEGADHFGLAQLHQLRGRVGRGKDFAFCFLVPESIQENVLERLKNMEQIADGMRLAEVDLALRGPGDLAGVAQSGLPEFRIASLTDTEMIKQAHEAAAETLRAGLYTKELARWAGAGEEIHGE